MSSTPTKQIDGDVAISRNVHIGGKTTIRGSVTVGHNLKIEGWLDAANIKGPNKGLFKTAVQLREAYPTPHEGWWALVGNTLPAQVYIADGGSWTASKNAEGNPILAGNPTIDSSECVEAIEAVEDMAAELDTVKANVGQNTEDIRDLRSSHTTQGNHINLLQKAVETAQARADKGVADAANAQTTATNAQAAAKAINDAKGVAGGFAPLDNDGKIPEEHLPMPDVVVFNATVESVTVQDSPTNTHSSAPGTHIVYDKSTKRLLLAIRTLSNVTTGSIDNDHLSDGEGGIQPPGTVSFEYYSDWADKDSFGIPSVNGVVPSKGKIYISTSDNKTWRWSGSELVIIGSDLALGFTNDTAFPGNEGAQLRNELDDLATAVAAKAENEDLLLVEQKNASIAILPFNGVFDPPTDGSVVQYPAQGVWWQPQEGNFLFLSSDLGYVAADYNTDGTARTDRIFRHDNILYRYDGTHLVDFGITDRQELGDVRMELEQLRASTEAGLEKALERADAHATEALNLAKTELEAADAELRQWTGGRLDDLDSMIGQEVGRVEQSIIDVRGEIESVNCTLSDDICLLRDTMDDLEGDVSYLQEKVAEHLAYPQGYYYGVRIDESSGDPVVQRIGNPALHVTLPIQSKMRRCILKDDGTVAYYLHPSDSTKKADGTPANLDGSDGMYMVEIPEHYAQFMHTSDVVAALISEYPLPGFHKVRKMYRSAVEATVDRSNPATPKLAAVCNATASFRGSGFMKTDWDTTSKSQLGRPATNESFSSFRAKARNRGSAGLNGSGWNCDTYEAVRTIYWLYVIEYANRNCQLPFNPEPNSSGYRQGGLGEGVTTVKNAASTEYYPFLPCGLTNSLGNASGVVNYTTEIIQDNTALKVAVPSYRGIENPFGHINSIVDGCLILIKSDGSSTLYTCDDPALFVAPDHGNAELSNYKECGAISNTDGYIKSIVYGDNGDIFPRIVNSGATSGTCYCDNYNTLGTSGMEMAVVPMHGGAFDKGYSAGMICWRPITDSYAYPNIGTRLCFIPEN